MGLARCIVPRFSSSITFGREREKCAAAHGQPRAGARARCLPGFAGSPLRSWLPLRPAVTPGSGQHQLLEGYSETQEVGRGAGRWRGEALILEQDSGSLCRTSQMHPPPRPGFQASTARPAKEEHPAHGSQALSPTAGSSPTQHCRCHRYNLLQSHTKPVYTALKHPATPGNLPV